MKHYSCISDPERVENELGSNEQLEHDERPFIVHSSIIPRYFVNSSGCIVVYLFSPERES